MELSLRFKTLERTGNLMYQVGEIINYTDFTGIQDITGSQRKLIFFHFFPFNWILA
jgi:hypothetical protein